VEEAREKLRLGMHILLREGTAARNLEQLLPLLSCQYVSIEILPPQARRVAVNGFAFACGNFRQLAF